MKTYISLNGAVDVIDVDQLPASKYTLPKDWSMEQAMPRTKDEECCSSKLEDKGLTLRQPL